MFQPDKKIFQLKKIGIIEKYQSPKEQELIQTMKSYDEIISEIRGI